MRPRPSERTPLRSPGHSSPYSHASASQPASPRSVCALRVSALDCSSLGFPLNLQLSTFNRLSFPFLTALLPYFTLCPSRDEKLVTATPLDSAVTNGDVAKSFRFRSYANCRVVLVSLTKKSFPKRSNQGLGSGSSLPFSISPFHFSILQATSANLHLYFQPLARCSSRNRFLFTLLHRCRGVYPSNSLLLASLFSPSVLSVASVVKIAFLSYLTTCHSPLGIPLPLLLTKGANMAHASAVSTIWGKRRPRDRT